MSIIISNISTWPKEVSDFLTENVSKFEGWACECCAKENPSGRDSLVTEFREILKKHSLMGYHCTKLTNNEIENIRENGMSVQNRDSLETRINQLMQSNLITCEEAKILKGKNQANDTNRAGMLWFCFYEPFWAGEGGIGRFFKSWGGEALYNSHENNIATGTTLRGIGTPCIIKANVNISLMKESKFPDCAMAKVLLSHSGHRIRIPIKHDGYSTQNISACDIVEIIQHPSEKFSELTKCETWRHSI